MAPASEHRAGGHVAGAGEGSSEGKGTDGAVHSAVVYLVRHGRTVLNAAGALRGHINVPLDDVGQEEAAAVARLLDGRGLRAVFSSPLRRALQTADAIARTSGLATTVDDRLVDRSYGEWAGLPVRDVIDRWGSVDAAPGVEAAADVRERALSSLGDVARQGAGAAVAAVSHDAVIKAALVAMDAGLGEPDCVPQGTGCMNTVLAHIADNGSVSWEVLEVNRVPARGPVPTTKEEQWQSP